jgi:hypothetical protein
MLLKIYGVYYICCINNYLEIVKEQLDILNKGLLQLTENLIIFITKYNNEECLELDNILKNYVNYDKFIIVKTPHNLFEKFAINNYKKYITTKEEYYLYYFHTKGVSYKIDASYNIFSSRRQVLNYYTLSQFNVNIELLKTYDAVGCSLCLNPKKHFSGNFWWSKSSYLQYLKNVNDDYLSPEMYILSNDNCKPVCLARNTNITAVENYVFRNEETILKNITTNYIDNK